MVLNMPQDMSNSVMSFLHQSRVGRVSARGCLNFNFLSAESPVGSEMRGSSSPASGRTGLTHHLKITAIRILPNSDNDDKDQIRVIISVIKKSRCPLHLSDSPERLPLTQPACMKKQSENPPPLPTQNPETTCSAAEVRWCWQGP